MDFELGVELTALRRRARDVALAGVAEHGAVNDSWINGYSRGFSRTLAAEGWIGMTWPTGHGGGGRPPIERIVMGEHVGTLVSKE